MMPPPAWCGKYIGLPYEDKGRGPRGFDCWGLVRHILSEQFGITTLPDYVDSYTSASDRNSVTSAVSTGLAQGWTKVAEPVPGAIVILLVAGRPWHCGLVVNKDWMVHTLKGIDVCIERFDSMAWRNRIEGFYQYVG